VGKNIEHFNIAAAAILATLYEAFPTPTDLHYGKIAASVAPDDLDEEGQFTFIAVVEDTATWLQREGFIDTAGRTYQTLDGGELANVRLTREGLAALNVVPEAVSGKASFGDALQEGLKDGAKAGVSDLMKELLAKGFGWIAAAAGTAGG
jgi:hypothetical protein